MRPGKDLVPKSANEVEEQQREGVASNRGFTRADVTKQEQS